MKQKIFLLTAVAAGILGLRAEARALTPDVPTAVTTAPVSSGRIDLRGVLKLNGKLVSQPHLVTALGREAMLGLSTSTGYKYELRLTPSEAPLPDTGETGVSIAFVLLESVNGSPLREVSRRSTFGKYDEPIEGSENTPAGEIYLQLIPTRVP
jgi:hypothetical protein